MNSTCRGFLTTLPLAAAISLALTATLSAQTEINMCYNNRTGVLYVIDPSGDSSLRTECANPNHLTLSFTDADGADHGALTGLANDDHEQYLPVDGSRTMTGGLSVGELIESTSGGFKFPDGTTQTTAASGGGGAFVPVDGVAGATDGFAVTGNLGSGSIPATGAGVRLMWYPGKAAFRAGEVGQSRPDVWDDSNVGSHSFAAGRATQASGNNSVALGPVATAAGTSSAAISGATANGIGAVAMGGGTADGDHSFAVGQGARATEMRAVAIGRSANGSGENATALGSGNATGFYATAAGWGPTASGEWSTAMGRGTTASGDGATSMGRQTTASGDGSMAVGLGAIASGRASTAIGSVTMASRPGSLATGIQSVAEGDASIAMGWKTIARGSRSVAIGSETRADGTASTAMGRLSRATGRNSTAMGYLTIASGPYSTALGYRADTDSKVGSFVYGDNSTASFLTAPADNSFTVRATGGTTFYSTASLNAGVSLAPGAGAWATVSDRNRKRDFQDVDGEAVLASIAAMPIKSWSYLSQDPSIRHLGPTAQDFYAAFGLGHDHTTITTSDISGVNMLAVQALEKRTAELRQENEQLRADNDELRNRLDRLEALLEAATPPIGNPNGLSVRRPR